MSAFGYENLPPWTRTAEAGPISAAPEHTTVMATYCHEDGDGDVVYSSDIPLIVRRCVPFLEYYAIVAEPKDPAQSAMLVGKELVMATWPLSRGWYDRGTFQFGSKHKVRKPGRQIEETLRQNPRMLRDLAREWRESPFDSRDWLATAILIDPYKLDPLKKYILGRQAYQKPMQLMSICDNLTKLRDKLMVDELLLDMVDSTYNARDLFLRFYKGRLHQMNLKKARASGAKGNKSPSHLVFENIARSDLAGEIMCTAVDLALAGPEDFSRFRSALDAQGRSGNKKLAKHRARDIYLQIYWNLWKRTATARRIATTARGARSRQKATVKDQEKEFWQAVKRAAANLDLSPQKIAATCNQLIESFATERDTFGQLSGPYHQEHRPVAGETRDDGRVILQFLLDAAALLDAGHRPESLCHVLNEIQQRESSNVQGIVGWIKRKHAILWDDGPENGDA